MMRTIILLSLAALLVAGCSSSQPAPAAPAGATKSGEKSAKADDKKGGESKGMSPNDLKMTDAAKGADSRVGSASGK